MKYLKYLLVLIFVNQIKTIDENTCENYWPLENLSECFNKTVEDKRYFCCGLNITYSSGFSRSICEIIPGNKYSMDIYKDIKERQYDANIDIVCPEEEVEVKGYCSDFLGFYVDNPNKCTNLAVDGERKRFATCCAIKYKLDQKNDEYPFPINVNMCIYLPKSKELRKATIEELTKQYNISGLEIIATCGSAITKIFSFSLPLTLLLL